jgi:hypothetical protein
MSGANRGEVNPINRADKVNAKPNRKLSSARVNVFLIAGRSKLITET